MIDKFHSKQHYNRFLVAKKYAKQVNDLLDKHFLIFDDCGDSMQEGRYVFGNNEEPMIGFKCGNTTFGYLGCVWDDDDLIYIEQTKKQIEKYFKSFMVVDPQDIKSIDLKE